MPPARTHVTVTPTSGLERAQVKWFNRLRGFGFLTRGEGTPDIFVHMETLRRFGMTELRPGQIVLVRFGPGPKGLMAAEVRPDGGRRGPAPPIERGPLPVCKIRHDVVILVACGVAALGFAALAAAPLRAADRADARDRHRRTGCMCSRSSSRRPTEARMRGLMFRKELPEGHGMLFDFKQRQPRVDVDEEHLHSRST